MHTKISYWLELAEYDLETARAMLEAKRYLYVGFMCHQAIEKILKAYFVKVYDLHPPKIHNLRLLACKCGISELLSDEQSSFLISLEPLNIETRYPTDKDKLFKSLTYKRCSNILNSTRELISWIKNKF